MLHRSWMRQNAGWPQPATEKQHMHKVFAFTLAVEKAMKDVANLQRVREESLYKG